MQGINILVVLGEIDIKNIRRKMTLSLVIKIMTPVTDKKNNVIQKDPTFMSSVKMNKGKFSYSLSAYAS